MPNKAIIREKVGLTFFWIFSILRNSDVKRGVFLLYWLQKGLTHEEIGILQSALFWSTLLAEIPTGMLADRFSPKVSLVAGAALRALNGFGYLVVEGFGPFLFFTCLSGLGFSFFSGAEQAYLHEHLNSRGLGQHYARFSARSKAISAFALASAIIAGGFLVRNSFALVFLVFGIVMSLGAIAGALLPPIRHTASSEGNELPSQSRKNIATFLKSKKSVPVLILALSVAFFEGAHTPYFIFSQTVFKNSFSTTATYTTLLAGIELLSAFSYLICERLVSRFRLANIVLATFTICTACILANLLNNTLLSSIAFAICMLVPTLMLVEVENKIQDELHDGIRATFFSIRSFIESSVISVSYYTLGRAFDSNPESTAISLLTIWPILAAMTFLYYLALTNRKGSSKASQNQLVTEIG